MANRTQSIISCALSFCCGAFILLALAIVPVALSAPSNSLVTGNPEEATTDAGVVGRTARSGGVESRAIITRATYKREACWTVSSVADFDNDKVNDILWRNIKTGEVAIDFMAWSVSAKKFLPLAKSGTVYTEIDQTWKIVAVEDLNGDKNKDIVWENFARGSNKVFIHWGPIVGKNTIKGDYIYPRNIAAEPFPQFADLANTIVGAGDFNGDKIGELLLRNTRTGDISVLNLGKFSDLSSVRKATVIYFENNGLWRILSTKDVNKDGTSDILWRNDLSGQHWIQYMASSASFKISTQGSIYSEQDIFWQARAFDNDRLIFHNTCSRQVVAVTAKNTSEQRLLVTTTADEELLDGTFTLPGQSGYSVMARNRNNGSVRTILVNGSNNKPFRSESCWKTRTTYAQMMTLLGSASADNYKRHYKTFESCGPRNPQNVSTFSSACPFPENPSNSADTGWSSFDRASLYIVQELRAMGFNKESITKQDVGSGYGYNTVLQIPGSHQPNEIIELTAHLDSALSSPGANDNGTGSGALLEIARVLRKYKNKHTIRLVWFAAEEISVPAPGSDYYLSQTYCSNGCKKRLIANLNIDTIGSRTIPLKGKSVARNWYRGVEGLHVIGLLNHAINYIPELSKLLTPMRQIPFDSSDIMQCVDFMSETSQKKLLYCRKDLDEASVINFTGSVYSKAGNWRDVCSEKQTDFLVTGQAEEATYHTRGLLNSTTSLGGFCYSILGFKFPIHSEADRSVYFDEDMNFMMAIIKQNLAVTMMLDNR